MSAAIKSVEDHGYVLDLGIQDISGFLPFKKAGDLGKAHIGMLLNVAVEKLSDDGRTCRVSADRQSLRSSSVCQMFKTVKFCGRDILDKLGEGSC